MFAVCNLGILGVIVAESRVFQACRDIQKVCIHAGILVCLLCVISEVLRTQFRTCIYIHTYMHTHIQGKDLTISSHGILRAHFLNIHK